MSSKSKAILNKLRRLRGESEPVLITIEGNPDACPERPMISAREALIEDNYYKADEGERRLVPQQVEGDLHARLAREGLSSWAMRAMQRNPQSRSSTTMASRSRHRTMPPAISPGSLAPPEIHRRNSATSSAINPAPLAAGPGLPSPGAARPKDAPPLECPFP
jgi:hypothetical protein